MGQILKTLYSSTWWAKILSEKYKCKMQEYNKMQIQLSLVLSKGKTIQI